MIFFSPHVQFSPLMYTHAGLYIFDLDHVLTKLSSKKDLKIPSNYCCTSPQPTMLFGFINFLMHRPPVSSLWKCESYLFSFIDKVSSIRAIYFVSKYTICIQTELSFHFIHIHFQTEIIFLLLCSHNIY